MILFIDEVMTYCESNSPDITEEDLEFQAEDAQYYREFFDQFSIKGVVENHEDHFRIKIYSQKITLDDLNMNTLFAHVIDQVFFNKYTLDYSAIGGKGCEFAMRIRRI